MPYTKSNKEIQESKFDFKSESDKNKRNWKDHNPYEQFDTSSHNVSARKTEGSIYEQKKHHSDAYKKHKFDLVDYGSAVPLLGKAVMAATSLGGMPYAGELKGGKGGQGIKSTYEHEDPLGKPQPAPPPTKYSAAPFKMRSGNSTPFKLMGSSSPIKFGVFGGAMGAIKGISNVFKSPKQKADEAAKAAATNEGTGGGDLESRVAALEASMGGGNNVTTENEATDPALNKDLKAKLFGDNTATATPTATASTGGAGGMIGAFSDIRLKENIERTGSSPSGIPIYEFNYINDSDRYSGAMAQDLLDSNPEAVSLDTSGYYMVNYNSIDVDMHLIN